MPVPLIPYLHGLILPSEIIIREATLEDMPGLLAIYNQVIATSTSIYFDQPLPLENRIAFFHQRARENYPIFVAVDAQGIAGFASFGDFRPYPGYRFTVEHSIHMRPDQRGNGLGQKLMALLFERARALNKHVILGVIDSDNAGSLRFHARFGFEKVAFMPEVGFKFGRRLDLVIMQKILSETPV